MKAAFANAMTLMVHISLGAWLGACFFAIEPPPESGVQTLPPGPLLSMGMTWRHQSGTSPATWTAVDFDDSAWPQSIAPMGFGECGLPTVLENNCTPGTCTDEETFACPEQFDAYYFRATFDIAVGRRADKLLVELLADDGAVVYLNGTEVGRVRMPAGPVDSTTRASEFVSGSDEGQIVRLDAAGALLREGSNVLAVEVHQDDGPDRDLFFDAALSVQ